MLESRTCPTCKTSYWSSRAHTCPPRWRVVRTEDAEQTPVKHWSLVYADTAEHAASEWTARWESDGRWEDEYDLTVRPADVEVAPVDEDEDEDEDTHQSRWTVYAQTSRDYYASRA